MLACKSLITGSTVALAMVTGASLAGAPARAAVVVSDTFTLNGTDRTAAAGLEGIATEVGGVSWTANSVLVFTADSNISSNANSSGPKVASVPIGGPGALDDIVSVKVDLNPNAAANAAMGFSSDHGNFNTSSHKNLWITLSNSGTLTLRQNGSGSLEQHSIGGEDFFTASALNTVEIIVNRQTSQVSVLVNETVVVDNFSVPLTDGSYLNRAGFMFTSPNQANGPQADNFTVTSVPEPASLGLAGMGLALLASRRRN